MTMLNVVESLGELYVTCNTMITCMVNSVWFTLCTKDYHRLMIVN